MGLINDVLARAYQAAHGAMGVPEIAVEDLKALLDRKEKLFLLDVREPSEHAVCHIRGDHLIPLAQLPGKAATLRKDVPMVVYCKVGGRSARAVRFLRRNGFEQAVHLEGGIDAWIERVDPTLPAY